MKRRWKPLLLMVWALLLCANLYAQQKEIVLSVTDGNLKNIFWDIEQQVGLHFMYQSEDLERAGRINIHLTSNNVYEVLRECLRGTGLTFIIQDRTVVVRPRADATSLIQVAGLVVDENDQPLPGVHIKVGNNAVGSTSDENGSFRFLSPKTAELFLEFSFVGMQTQRVKYKEQSLLRVKMKEEIPVIEEVVVTGYAAIAKTGFTGTSTVVSREELLLASPHNLLQSVQLFDPSFRIAENLNAGSNPNQVPEFYIRNRSGIGVTELSIGAVSENELKDNPNLPTIIIDGYESDIQQLCDLDPSRVKSVTILKDAAATAIYGSRAANGVLVVETVAPSGGKLQVNYTFNSGLSFPDLSDYNLCNASQKLEVERLAGFFHNPNALPNIQLEQEKLYYQKQSEIQRGVDTYWLSQPLRLGFSQKHNVNISGGSKSIQYGINLKLDNTAGVMKGSLRNRKGINVSLSYNLNKFQFRNQIEWNHILAKESPYGSFEQYTTRNPYDSATDDLGNYKPKLTLWAVDLFRENPLYEASLSSFDKQASHQITNNFNLKWFATENFRLEARVALGYEHNEGKRFTDPMSMLFANEKIDQRGSLQVSASNRMNWDVNAFATYSESMGKGHLSATAGMNMREGNVDYSSYRLTGFGSGATSDQNFAAHFFKPSGGSALKRLVGFFLQANYTIDDTYLFDLAGRYDGTSQFGEANKFAPFYSMGAGINIHSYPWMKENLPWVNQLKIRGTYGILGNANFNQNLSKMMYEYNFDSWYLNGLGATIKVLGNPELKWEKSANIDLGVDLTLFEYYSMYMNYYRKNTNNLIGDITLPASTGFTSYKSNLGEVINEGFECQLQAGVVHTRELKISLYGSLSHNSNKIRKISDGLRTYNKAVEEYYKSHPDYNQPLRKYYDGNSLTAIYAMKSLGINPADGREIFLTKEGKITNQWDTSQVVVCGDTEPTIAGAFGINITYKGFFLFSGLNYERGGQMENRTLYDKVEGANLYGNVDRRVLEDRWQKPGDIKGFKSLQRWKEVTRPTSRFIQDNNYLAFNSLSVGYTFPASMLRKTGNWHLSNLRVQLSANNLGRISSIDRERGLSYPYARTVNLTIGMGL